MFFILDLLAVCFNNNKLSFSRFFSPLFLEPGGTKKSCQIFHGSKYQSGEKIPKDHKIYQISLNIPNGHKVCKSNATLQGGIFGVKVGILSGNPDLKLVSWL
jgi:hypothetical protein